MNDKGKGEDMSTTFAELVKQNKDKIRSLAESNTQRNSSGIPVISKDDPWRKETEWDQMYIDLTKKQ